MLFRLLSCFWRLLPLFLFFIGFSSFGVLFACWFKKGSPAALRSSKMSFSMRYCHGRRSCLQSCFSWGKKLRLRWDLSFLSPLIVCLQTRSLLAQLLPRLEFIGSLIFILGYL